MRRRLGSRLTSSTRRLGAGDRCHVGAGFFSQPCWCNPRNTPVPFPSPILKVTPIAEKATRRMPSAGGPTIPRCCASSSCPAFRPRPSSAFAAPRCWRGHALPGQLPRCPRPALASTRPCRPFACSAGPACAFLGWSNPPGCGLLSPGVLSADFRLAQKGGGEGSPLAGSREEECGGHLRTALSLCRRKAVEAMVRDCLLAMPAAKRAEAAEWTRNRAAIVWMIVMRDGRRDGRIVVRM